MTRLVLAAMAALMVQAGCADGGPPASNSAEATGTGDARRILRPAGYPSDRPYSYGVRVGDTVYLSGQLGRHPGTAEMPDGIDAQTRQAMENIAGILASDGLGLQHLVKCHVYLASMDDYAGMNKVYGSFFQDRVPARTTVEAAAVPGGGAVEIACIAHAALEGISVVTPPAGSLPAPLGPYSAAVRAGETVYLSGMGGQNPADRSIGEGLPAQVTQTLANIGTTLTAAGLGFEHVVSTTAYITTPGEMDGFEAALVAPFTGVPAPTASIVYLPRLPGPIKAELTFIATTQRGRRAYVPAATAPEAGADVMAQGRAIMARLRQAVEAEGLVWSDVAHVQVYLADLGDVPAMDALYRESFPEDPPARTTIQAQLQGDAKVQVSIIAARE